MARPTAHFFPAMVLKYRVGVKLFNIRSLIWLILPTGSPGWVQIGALNGRTAGRQPLPSRDHDRCRSYCLSGGQLPLFMLPGFEAISSVIMKPLVPLNSYCFSPVRHASTVLGMSTKPSLWSAAQY